MARAKRRVDVLYEKEQGMWLVETDNGATASRHRKKQNAYDAAKRKVRGSDIFEQVQVFKKNGRVQRTVTP